MTAVKQAGERVWENRHKERHSHGHRKSLYCNSEQFTAAFSPCTSHSRTVTADRLRLKRIKQEKEQNTSQSLSEEQKHEFSSVRVSIHSLSNHQTVPDTIKPPPHCVCVCVCQCRDISVSHICCVCVCVPIRVHQLMRLVWLPWWRCSQVGVSLSQSSTAVHLSCLSCCLWLVVCSVWHHQRLLQCTGSKVRG